MNASEIKEADKVEADHYLEKINFQSVRDSDDLETAISIQWYQEMKRSLHLSTLLEQDNLAPLFAGAQWAGTRVWHAAIAMVQYLLDHHSEQLKDEGGNNCLLELGCGLGVPGMICHDIFQNETYLTDQESIMSQLEKNIQSNFSSSNNLYARPLSWSKEMNPLLKEKSFDIVICCDCIYEPLYGDSWKLLIHVINHVLEKNPKSVVLISVERRNADGIDDFLTELQASSKVQKFNRMWKDEEFKIEIYQIFCN